MRVLMSVPTPTRMKGAVMALAVLVALAVRFIAWPAEPTALDPVSGQLAQSPTLADIAAIPDGFDRNREMYRFLATADREPIERLLDRLGDLPPDGQDVARVAYLRFAALDPGAAVARALSEAVEPSVVATVFRSWAHRDLDAAVSRAAVLPEPARVAVARAILELDLPAARLMDAASRLDATELLIEFETRGNRGNIETVWDRAISNAEDPLRGVRLRVVAEIWSVEDPAAALAATELLPPGALRDELRAVIVDVWSGADPGAAAVWFASSGQEDVGLAETAFAALAERDVERAWSLTELLPARAGSATRSAILHAALIEDFDGALAFFDTLSDTEDLEELVWFVIAGYGDRPREALEWAMSRDEASGTPLALAPRDVPPDTATPNLFVWVYLFGGRNPALAKDVIEDIADPTARDWAVGAYLALGPLFGPISWPGRDTRADVLWAESIASEEYLLDPEIAKALMRLDSDNAVDAMLRRDPSPALDEALGVALGRSDRLASDDAERLLAAISSQDARRREARRLYLRHARPTDGQEKDERQDFLALCRYEFDTLGRR